MSKFKHSDQLNARRRDSKKQDKIRGGAKNTTQSYFLELEDDDQEVSPPSREYNFN